MMVEKIKPYFVENFVEISFKETRKSKCELLIKQIFFLVVVHFGL